jgi:hypothetical protein
MGRRRLMEGWTMKLPRALGLVLGLIALPGAFALLGIIVGLILFGLIGGRHGLEKEGSVPPLCFLGAFSGAAVGVWLAFRFYGPRLQQDRPAPPTQRARESHGADAAAGLLRRSGWNVAEAQAGSPEEPFWWVTGSRGDGVLDVTGKTRAEAWHRAVEQARSLGTLAGGNDALDGPETAFMDDETRRKLDQRATPNGDGGPSWLEKLGDIALVCAIVVWLGAILEFQADVRPIRGALFLVSTVCWLIAVFGGGLSAVARGSKAGCLAFFMGILLLAALIGLLMMAGSPWLD